MIFYHILLLIFCLLGLLGLIDSFLQASSWKAIEYKDLFAPIALIISAIALWLNLINRELNQANLQHENARKLRDRFYSKDMQSILEKIAKHQRTEGNRQQKVEIYYDDNNKNVKFRTTGSTAIGWATASFRSDHYKANETDKFNLENFIISTINIFKEAISLLDRGLITEELIKTALPDDFKFSYRVVAHIIANYSKDGILSFENIEVERLNKRFQKIYGNIENENIITERKHISEDPEKGGVY